MASSSRSGSAFEPSSNFMFAEASSDEEFRNMQRSIASLQVLPGHNQGFQHGMNGVHEHDDMNNLNNQDPSNFENPFMFDPANLSQHSASWLHEHAATGLQPQSTQAEIANDRSASVTQQFGQITPPNDHIPTKGFTPVQHHFNNPSLSGERLMSAKSERARNAANQRHAKAKKAKKNGDGQDDGTDLADSNIDEGRRERYREKNRLAAAKCRAKKKVNTEDLEQSARMASAENNKLRAEERELRDLFSSLRNQALAHDPSQGCNCSAIHSYNLHKAQEAARGAMGLRALMTESPTHYSMDTGSPNGAQAASRAQSFSGMRPPCAKHQARSLSLATQMGYMAPSEGSIIESLSASSELDNSGYEFAQNQTGLGGEDFSEYIQRSPNSHQLY